MSEAAKAVVQAEQDNCVKNGTSSTEFRPVLRYDEYWDIRTLSYQLKKTAKPGQRLGKRQSVLVVRRKFDHKGRYVETLVDIKSSWLGDVLRDLHKGIEGHNLEQSPPQASTELLFHSRHALKEIVRSEEAKSDPNQHLIRDVGIALDYINEEYAGTLRDLDSLIEAGSITWSLLWALFPPNGLISHYHDLTEQTQLLQFKYLRRVQTSCRLFWRLSCDQITDDGNHFGVAKQKELEIDHYEGARPIADLLAVPLERLKNKDDVLQHAVERGKRIAKLTGQCYKEIWGAAMREEMNERYEKRRFKFASHGRVMIDPIGFRTFCPGTDYNYAVHKSIDRDCLTDEQYAICTPILLGFCFGVKMWGGFAMDRLTDIRWTDEAFPSLVLDQAHKSLIHGLVAQHSSESKRFDDVVKGKGRGLIGLLSGLPGCGKTLTAEAVSEKTRRPLYTVSAGELGVEPAVLDKHLTRVLELAARWNAVLLLDEADVFLQARDNLDVNRNALVSIFLRQLEYYQGILILTTNRIGSCDPAFESRIHFSIYYPRLDLSARREIWKTFWKKAATGMALHSADAVNGIAETGATSEASIYLSNDELDFLARYPINGRQIKNTVSSAQSMALQEGKPLSIEHVKTVLMVVKSWSDAASKEDE